MVQARDCGAKLRMRAAGGEWAPADPLALPKEITEAGRRGEILSLEWRCWGRLEDLAGALTAIAETVRVFLEEEATDAEMSKFWESASEVDDGPPIGGHGMDDAAAASERERVEPGAQPVKAQPPSAEHPHAAEWRAEGIAAIAMDEPHAEPDVDEASEEKGTVPDDTAQEAAELSRDTAQVAAELSREEKSEAAAGEARCGAKDTEATRVEDNDGPGEAAASGGEPCASAPAESALPCWPGRHLTKNHRTHGPADLIRKLKDAQGPYDKALHQWRRAKKASRESEATRTLAADVRQKLNAAGMIFDEIDQKTYEKITSIATAASHDIDLATEAAKRARQAVQESIQANARAIRKGKSADLALKMQEGALLAGKRTVLQLAETPTEQSCSSALKRRRLESLATARSTSPRVIDSTTASCDDDSPQSARSDGDSFAPAAICDSGDEVADTDRSKGASHNQRAESGSSAGGTAPLFATLPQYAERGGDRNSSAPVAGADIEATRCHNATLRLRAWIHACGRALAEKLHGPTALTHAGAAEFTEDPDWEVHQRLEINTRLDGVSREVVYEASSDADDVKLQKCWVTRLLLNKQGARSRVETEYEKRAGRSLYAGELDEQTLADAFADVKLDSATRGMRRAQWNAESKKRGLPGKQDQRKSCASLWSDLRRQDAFRTSLAQLADQRMPLKRVLRETLRVQNAFLGMLVARDLAVLLPQFVSQADVDACTVVGEPAESVLVACTVGPRDGRQEKGVWRYSTETRKTCHQRLKSLHENLCELLDPHLLKIVVPQGWTLDLTENSCCELRRWDKARKHRKRKGAAALEERQKKRLVQLRATWQQLGFASMPAAAMAHADPDAVP